MTKEQYISSETAILAREMGFDNQSEFDSVDDELPFSRGILRSTQARLARWLREKHGKNVYAVMSIKEKYIFWIQDINSLTKVKTTDLYDTYEEALEEGLKEGLKLIKEDK